MIIAYKAFDKDLSCTSGGNRFQYKLGIWNEEKEANCARNGFHCAENPLDCLYYYPYWNQAVYYLVLADGDINEDGRDSRISCTRMKLVKQLELPQFVAHSLQFLYCHPYREKSHYYIQSERGETRNGFTIVRGKNPAAKGRHGDVLGLLKEEPDSRKIAEIGIYVIDDKNIMSDTWYGLEGEQEAE